MGESRSRRIGIRDDAAPELETDPISSWLKRAMQFTFPSSGNDWVVAWLASASNAAKLRKNM